MCVLPGALLWPHRVRAAPARAAGEPARLGQTARDSGSDAASLQGWTSLEADEAGLPTGPPTPHAVSGSHRRP